MTYKECKEYIRSDYYRITGRKNDGMFKMWLKSHLETGFHFLFWWRLAHLDRFAFPMRFISRYLGIKHHICIERFTDIGYGFHIVHGGPIVVHYCAHIGDNCNIHQYSTIGSNGEGVLAPNIGDNVDICASVCIIGDVNVGNNSTIGAGSIVVKDVPENATVAGNPAKVVSYKTPARFINRMWEKQ